MRHQASAGEREPNQPNSRRTRGGEGRSGGRRGRCFAAHALFRGEGDLSIPGRETKQTGAGRRMRHHARGPILLLVLLYLGICVLIPLNIWERGRKRKKRKQVTNHWHYCCWFDTLLGARGVTRCSSSHGDSETVTRSRCCATQEKQPFFFPWAMAVWACIGDWCVLRWVARRCLCPQFWEGGAVAVPLPVFLQRAEYMETEKQMKYV